MTTIHPTMIGNQVILPQDEWDRLLTLARQAAAVAVEGHEEDLPALGLMILAEKGGAFQWLAEEEDLYTWADLKVRYR